MADNDAPVSAPAVPETPAPETLVDESPVVDGGTGQESLTDEQLRAKIRGEKPPDTPPEKETETETGTTPPPEGEKKPEEKPPEAPKLFAGKYKTEADLVKGIQESAKKIGMDEKSVQYAISAAQTAKDTAALENLYKWMERQHPEKKEAPPPVQAPPAPVSVEGADDELIAKAAAEQALDEIANLPVVRAMRAQGIEVPRTQEELNELKKVSPADYVEFVQAFRQKFNERFQDYKEHVRLLSTVESVNKQTTDSEITAIRAFATQYGFPAISDEEAQKLVEDSKEYPVAYEENHGVRFLKSGGLMKYYMAEVFPGKMQEYLVAHDGTIRAQAAEDLKKLQKESVQSISTAGGGQKRETEAPKVDYTNEKEVAKVSDKALKEKIKEAFSRK